MEGTSLVKTLARLDQVPGVSGYEEGVAAALKAEMDGLYDQCFDDPVGNIYFLRQGKADFTLMLTAHMDELGLMVSYIEANGFLRFVGVGFHSDRNLISQRLIVHSQGGDYLGITGSKPAHLLNAEEKARTIPCADLFIDVGATSREEAEAWGIRIGDTVTFDTQGGLLNNTRTFYGRAVDDRAGCAVLVEVLRRLAAKGFDRFSVCAVGTVQEEVGIRGAGVAGHKVAPDQAIAVDVGLAGGTPATLDKDLPLMLGQGPAVKIFDWSPAVASRGSAVPAALTRKLIAAAEANQIPYQREVLIGGATDAWGLAFSGNGVAAMGLSIPSHYIHSSASTIHLDDLENTVKLILAYIETL